MSFLFCNHIANEERADGLHFNFVLLLRGFLCYVFPRGAMFVSARFDYRFPVHTQLRLYLDLSSFFESPELVNQLIAQQFDIQKVLFDSFPMVLNLQVNHYGRDGPLTIPRFYL